MTVVMITVPLMIIFVIDFFTRLPNMIYKEPINPFYEIVIPPKNPSNMNKVFKYNKIINKNKGKCINRKKTRNEFIRVLGKNFRIDDMKEPRQLVIGASTVLGAAISRKFSYKGIPYIAINGINELDFSSLDSFIPFENVTISKAYIVYQPPFYHHSSTDGSDYLNSVALKYITGITNYLNEKEIPFVFAPISPISEEMMTLVLQNGGCIVQVPYLVDKDAFYDLENPTMRAVRECRISGKSTIDVYPNMFYHSIMADDASKFIRHQIKYDNDIKKGRFMIYGASNISIEKAVRTAVSAAGLDKCQINFVRSIYHTDEIPETNHKALIGDEDDNVTKMIAETFQNFNRLEKDRKYLSIVVTGRNDNFSNGFEKRAQIYLDRINEALEKVPLADIEILFVDYATDIHKYNLLDKVLTFGKNLIGKIQFIIIPQTTHYKLIKRFNTSQHIPFLEYIAKNIGIRRAKGKFVLTTNPDDLLSDEFFDLVAARQFNAALLYRASRFDEQDSTYDDTTFQQIIQSLNEPWSIQKYSIKQRSYGTQRFSIIDSYEAFELHSSPSYAGDFIMLSKKMWDAVEGFNEFPANPKVDSLFLGKLMKFVPGYAQMFMFPFIYHLKHSKQSIFRPSVENHSQLIQEYFCSGKCLLCGQYDDISNWGLSDESFEIHTPN